MAIPSLSGFSDVVGRRVVMGWALALHGVAALLLGLSPDSIVAVAVCQLLTGLCGVILPVSQAIIVDISG